MGSEELVVRGEEDVEGGWGERKNMWRGMAAEKEEIEWQDRKRIK
jgi:hypothetical protein